MIFITVGSQKFQFNRLLKEVDELVEKGIITEEVFAQTGYSDYRPKNYQYKDFLDRDEFMGVMKRCDKVITHGGTGAVIGAVKQKKKVIAIPRLVEFGEHVDNHQIQLLKEFEEMGMILSCYDISKLDLVLKNIEMFKAVSYVSNSDKIIESIEKFLKNCKKDR